jgi:hypothetical protein
MAAKRQGRRGRRLAGVIAIVLGGLYAALRLHQPEPAKPPPNRTVSFGLTVGAPLPESPLPIFTVHRGDKVVILIRSEVAGELRLQGYDRTIPLRPGGAAKLTFGAGTSGQFPIALRQGDRSERVVARLAVQPQ